MPASGKAGTDTDKAYNATLARVLAINPSYDPVEYGNAEKILAGWRDGAKTAAKSRLTTRLRTILI
jgi:hypothetical protein